MAAVDQNKMAQLLVCDARAPGESLIKREPFRIALSPVDALEVPARFDELVDHLPFARREAADGKRHVDLAEFCELSANVFGRRAVRNAGGRVRELDQDVDSHVSNLVIG